MTEFLTLVGLGVLVVGLGVLAASYLLTMLGRLVVRIARRWWPTRTGTRGDGHRRAAK
jgi:hypothetical protein